MTRAKRHVCVICDVDCVSTDPILKSFTEYLVSNADVRTATQYDHLRVEVVRPQGMELTLRDAVTKKSDAKKASRSSDAKRVEKKSKASTKKPGDGATKRDEKQERHGRDDDDDDDVTLLERRQELLEMVQTFVESKTETIFRFEITSDLKYSFASFQEGMGVILFEDVNNLIFIPCSFLKHCIQIWVHRPHIHIIQFLSFYTTFNCSNYTAIKIEQVYLNRALMIRNIFLHQDLNPQAPDSSLLTWALPSLHGFSSY